MKDSTIIVVISALMVILIALVLCIYALDSPQEPHGVQETGIVTYSYPSNSTGFGQGEGDPKTNQNTTYVECNGKVCNVTKIPWVTPTFALQYTAGGGGAGTISYVWVNYSSYPIAVGGGGGAAGTYQGGTK